MAGGVLTLTDEMLAKARRPIWIGYIHVADVDAAVEAIEADGGEVLMPPWDQPGVGRLAMVADPQGAPFYLMNPTPARGPSRRDQRRLLGRRRRSTSAGTSCSTTDQDRAVDFYTRHFGWTQEGAMPMGEMGEYQFVQCDGVGDRRDHARAAAKCRQPAGSTISGSTTSTAPRSAVADGGGDDRQRPDGDAGRRISLIGIDPQGAVFGLVGPRKA